MDKSVHSKQYEILLELLVARRKAANTTQLQLSERLEMTQSAYSKLERGELRIDVVQLRAILVELGVPLLEFIADFEKQVAQQKPSSRSRRK